MTCSGSFGEPSDRRYVPPRGRSRRKGAAARTHGSGGFQNQLHAARDALSAAVPFGAHGLSAGRSLAQSTMNSSARGSRSR
jgi:hypothetical protein